MAKSFKKSINYLVVISLLFLATGASLTANADNDKEKYKPIYAEDVTIGKKIKVDNFKDIEKLESANKGIDKAGKRKPTVPVTYATGSLGGALPAGAKQYAIIIGISDYPGTSNDLNFTDDDAIEMYDTLTQVYNYNPANIVLLTDRDHIGYDYQAPTGDNIYNAILEMKNTVTSGDEFVFFYSGHGANGKANDGDSEAIDEAIVVHNETALQLMWDGQMKQWFNDYQADRMVFIFDSCYSGGMTDLKGTNRIVNMASGEKQLSYEVGGDISNGIFTEYFVQQGMHAGKANIHDYDNDGDTLDPSSTSIEEAFDYAFPLNKTYQTPVISDQFTNDLLL